MENPFEILMNKLELMQEQMNRIEEAVKGESGDSQSKQGGIELAQAITGYSVATIRKKASKGELPVISEPYAKLRFDKQQLLDYMKAKARPTKEQLKEKIDKEYATLKRLRKPKK